MQMVWKIIKVQKHKLKLDRKSHNVTPFLPYVE